MHFIYLRHFQCPNKAGTEESECHLTSRENYRWMPDSIESVWKMARHFFLKSNMSLLDFYLVFFVLLIVFAPWELFYSLYGAHSEYKCLIRYIFFITRLIFFFF